MKTILTIIALFVAVSVQAQPASQQIPNDARALSTLQSELEVKIAEVKTLDGTMGNLTVENERLMKENKVLADNRTEQNTRLRALVDAGTLYLNNEHAKRQAEIDVLKSQYLATGCSGQVTQDRLAYCQGLHRALLAQTEPMAKEGDAFIKRERNRIEAEHAPTRDIINRQTARINQIAATMTSNFNDFTKAQDKVKAHKERISEIRIQMNNLCTNPNATLAAKQLCKIYRDGNWDGARTNLPQQTGPGLGTRSGENR